MNHTEHTARTRSPRIGIFATLRAVLPANGTGAPSARPRRLALAAAVLAAALGLAATQALGAAKPAVSATAATHITETAARLSAEVDPEGQPTTYQFQYLTQAEYEADADSYAGPDSPAVAPAAPAEIGSGSSFIAVAEGVPGLAPGTTYHFRLLATNGSGTTEGPDTAFATYPVSTVRSGCSNESLREEQASTALPDCRAYEQATPVFKDGSDAVGGETIFQASPDGSRISFYSPVQMPGGVSQTGPSSARYLASRSAAGWTTSGLALPVEAGGENNPIGWSEDLSHAFLKGQALGLPQGYYLSDTATGAYSLVGEGFEHVTADDSTPDGSRFIFETKANLPVANHSTPTGSKNKLYEWETEAEQLTLVDLLPAAEGGAPPAEGAFAGPYKWITAEKTRSGAESAYYTLNTISTDGSRVFWTAGATGKLYVRENPSQPQSAVNGSDECTEPAKACTALVSATAHFDAANPAGTELLADEGGKLFEYTIDAGAHGPAVSASEITPSGSAGIQGVLGLSEDGTYVYFAANAVLAANEGAQGSHAAAGNCTDAALWGTGACNLYLAHYESGAWHTTFIAPMSNSLNAEADDSLNWYPQAEHGVRGYHERTARVSPDGATLLFRSNLNQTPYQGHGTPELYRFEAAAGPQHLLCVSCDPTGAPPAGAPGLGGVSTSFFASTVGTPFLTRNLAPDGDRVFFETPDALVPADTNGVNDVYEWEADGTGACARAAGCLYLISTGASPDPSYFGDASLSGDDAFFLTRQPLVAQDNDRNVDVYDARVQGGLAAQNQAPAAVCGGEEACRPPASSPPAEPSPSSSTFNGPGNEEEKPPVKCKPGFARRHGQCVKKHPRKHHKGHRLKRASHNRGGSK